MFLKVELDMASALLELAFEADDESLWEVLKWKAMTIFLLNLGQMSLLPTTSYASMVLSSYDKEMEEVV